MKFLGLEINFPTFTRNKKGDYFYDITSHNEWTKSTANLHIAQNHPIFTPALLFVSKLFSQAQFTVEFTSSGKEAKNATILELLNNPNQFMTLPDLLETLEFTKRANGVGVLYAKKNVLRNEVNSLYVLDYNLIEWPEDIKKGKFINASQHKKYLKRKVVYDKNNENFTIKLEDLLFFYDLPNGMDKNPYKTESIVDGLKQTLINTKDSLIAKNIILKSNGKELFTTAKGSTFPLNKDEKDLIENNYNNNYGVSFTRKRGIVTSAEVTHKSLHIALRDLGLDESVKVDGNMIYTALHIPKDILSLEAKKTTYNNFKESMVSYIQNEMQTTLDSFCAVINKAFGDKYKIKGTYEHLPIMQFILIERYKGVWERGNALFMLRKSGLPDAISLEMVGLDPTIQLGELTQGEASQSEDPDKYFDEERIEEIISRYYEQN